ncbi:hypothetical protein [Kitasatospora phosalacinea]|uniref:Uncharacterized protein n=1 Tax=Kitasatospora phosalacinea TaxID=2065 RepID=A0ABW6GU93_9ACTN
MSLHPAGPGADGAAVTRHWSGRLLDAGLRQHTAEAPGATEATESTDSPSPQPNCPPEDTR